MPVLTAYYFNTSIHFKKVNFSNIMDNCENIWGKMVQIHYLTNNRAHCVFLVLRHVFSLSSLESKCAITLSDSSQLQVAAFFPSQWHVK